MASLPLCELAAHVAIEAMLLFETSIIPAKPVLVNFVQENYVNLQMTIFPRDDNDPQR